MPSEFSSMVLNMWMYFVWILSEFFSERDFYKMQCFLDQNGVSSRKHLFVNARKGRLSWKYLRCFLVYRSKILVSFKMIRGWNDTTRESKSSDVTISRQISATCSTFLAGKLWQNCDLDWRTLGTAPGGRLILSQSSISFRIRLPVEK